MGGEGLSVQKNYLRSEWQVVFGDRVLGASLYLSQAHFLEEIFHWLEVAVGFRGFIVHGEYRLRLQLADNLGSHGGINRGNAAHGHHQDIDFTQFLDMVIAEDMADIAEVTNRHSIDFHEIDGIFPLRLPFDGIVISGNPQHQNAADFIFAGAFNQSILSADTLIIGVGRVRVADGNDISGLLAEGVTQTGRKGVRNHDGLITANTEA